MKRVLVTGSARFWESAASHRARRIGAELARLEFALTTGAEPGVDKAASEGFTRRARDRGMDLPSRFTQLKEPFRFQSWLNVSPGFDAGPCRRNVARGEWVDVAVETCDSAVMIGGRWGALAIARAFLEAGKPVFPVPFVPGRSDVVFQDVLRNWFNQPVPGLTRNQFLRLSLPWSGKTEPLTDLLLGALADSPDVFISYRRADAGWAAGRLQAELADRLGEKRVFSDVTHLRAGQTWRTVLEQVVANARVGIVVVGRDWLRPRTSTEQPRLRDDDDIVRMEVRALLTGRKKVIVALADAHALSRTDLPPDLAALADIQGIQLTHENWQESSGRLLSAVLEALDAAEP